MIAGPDAMPAEPITFTIPGLPIGKGRARVTRTGHAYTPAATRSYETAIRFAAAEAMRGAAPIEGPVAVELLAQLPIPPSWSKRKQAAALTGELRPTGRPDLDNVLKAALDGVNAIVVRDDAQAVEFRCRKVYAATPCLIVTIKPLEIAA